jgi:hypothetical protein
MKAKSLRWGTLIGNLLGFSFCTRSLVHGATTPRELIFVVVFSVLAFLVINGFCGVLIEFLDSTRNNHPPRWARFIALMIPRQHREHLLGDLEEEFYTVLVPEFGNFTAKLWYWWQVLASVSSLFWSEVRNVLGTALFWRITR